MDVVFTIIGLILLLCGIIFVFDARILSKNKIFDRFDANTAVRIVKTIGFLSAVGGSILIYFFMKFN